MCKPTITLMLLVTALAVNGCKDKESESDVGTRPTANPPKRVSASTEPTELDSRVQSLISSLDGEWHAANAAEQALVTIGAPAVDALVTALNHHSPHIAERAAGALGAIGDRRAVEPLIVAMREKHLYRAALALGVLRDERAFEPLIRAINDSEVHTQAVLALGDLGDARCVKPLLAVLHKDDTDLQAAAAEVLGRFHDAEAVEPLIRLLDSHSDQIRKNAAESLGALGDARAVETLIRLLQNSNIHDSVGFAAAEALVKIGDIRAIPSLVDYHIRDTHMGYADEGEPSAVQRGLVNFGSASVDELLRALNRTSRPTNIACLLGEIADSRAIDPLLAAARRLEPSDHHDLGAICRAVVQIGPASVDPLLTVLTENDPKMRRLAARALGGLGDPKAVEPLIAMVKTEAGEWERESAAISLGKLRDKRAIDVLVAALRNERYKFARHPCNHPQWARDALIGYGDAAVRPIISTLLDDPEAGMEHGGASGIGSARSCAAGMLAEIGGEHAFTALIKVLETRNPNEHRFLDTGETSEPYCDARAKAAIALGVTKDKRAFAPLVRALTDVWGVVRSGAAVALGNLGEPEATSHLVEVLPDWYAGKAAAASLEKLGFVPKNEQDQVHLMVAKGDTARILASWDKVVSVLTGDIRTGSIREIDNALYTFMYMGQESIVDPLISLLEKHGTKTIAEAYLNCGHKRLAEAAKAWASRHGYYITEGSGAAPVRWGAGR